MSAAVSVRTHSLTISNRDYPYLDRIIDGSKTIEGRTNSPHFHKLKPGDHIHFYNHQKWARCAIIAVRVYRSFQEMLKAETLEKVLPGTTDFQEGVAMYHKFPGVEANERKFGVLAIEIAKLTVGTVQQKTAQPSKPSQVEKRKLEEDVPKPANKKQHIEPAAAKKYP